ncbi:hypothetical protein ElyMa_003832300 [Elysia marginata]|uniref:CS domain-containing protein n=1 Tax=Elysia marginata TaxID=1093978 RepID=A0AAV4FGU2_9GAST|nr:hypothetical protein ElyMa_003832300 [Elysia marginata]
MPDDSPVGYKIKRRVLGEVWVRDVEKEIVTLDIPCNKLIPTDNKHLPKNGECYLQFSRDNLLELNSTQSFEIKLTLRDDEEKVKTKYNFKLRQLPGPINRQRSSWDIVKGKIVVKLHKMDKNDDWTLPVKCKGIDQLNSDESS